MELNNQSDVSFEKNSLSYEDTGYFSKTILDYISESPNLSSFYGLKPLPESFKEQIANKRSFEHRDVLVENLKRQYKEGGIKKVNFDDLLDKDTFTITTGHQLCLFTGPLYFIYKIASAIKTCEILRSKYPECNFKPVFWMASEDHDFQEANHFFLQNRKVEWESGQLGAVGRMKTVGMGDLAEEIKKSFGVGYHSARLHELFSNAYTRHSNVADATRYLVHELFKDYGVVVIDGDDRSLKSLASPYFRKEFTEQASFKLVQKTNKELGQDYKLQVTPREINLFYLDDEVRERFVEKGDGKFGVNRTDLAFTQDEIDHLLETEPEKFSPNVILRPLYQEIILPNLAYIGGGGEIAYWFQLKRVFDEHNIPFPILMLRNSAMFMSERSEETMNSLGLRYQDLFLDEVQLEKLIILGNNTDELNLDDERGALKDAFDKVESRLGGIDPTLRDSVQSGFARSERIMKNLEKKMYRATKRKEKLLIEKIERLKDDLFPSGSLQERRANFSLLYALYGEELTKTCIKNFDPFDFTFTIFNR